MKKKRKKQLNCSVAMSHWLALLKWGTDLLRLETVTCWVSGRCWFNMLYCHIRLMNLMCCIAAGHIFWLAVVSFVRYQQHVVLHQAWRQYMEELIPSSRWVTQQAACCLAQGHKLCVWSTKYTSTKYSLCHCAVLLCTGRGTILVYSFGSLCCPFLFWSGTSLMYSLWHCAVPLCTGSGTILMYSFSHWAVLCVPEVEQSWCILCAPDVEQSWCVLCAPDVKQSWCILCVIGLSFVYQKLNTVQVAQVCRVFTMSCQLCSTVCVWAASTAQVQCKQHVRSFWRQNFKAACWKCSAPSVPPMLGSVVLSCRNLDILSTSSHQMIL